VYSLTFAFALCCHSNATRAPIANPSSSAQTGGILYHPSPSYFRVCAIVWACGRGQTDRHTYRRAWPQYISRHLYDSRVISIAVTYLLGDLLQVWRAAYTATNGQLRDSARAQVTFSYCSRDINNIAVTMNCLSVWFTAQKNIMPPPLLHRAAIINTLSNMQKIDITVAVTWLLWCTASVTNLPGLLPGLSWNHGRCLRRPTNLFHAVSNIQQEVTGASQTVIKSLSLRLCLSGLFAEFFDLSRTTKLHQVKLTWIAKVGHCSSEVVALAEPTMSVTQCTYWNWMSHEMMLEDDDADYMTLFLNFSEDLYLCGHYLLSLITVLHT